MVIHKDDRDYLEYDWILDYEDSNDVDYHSDEEDDYCSDGWEDSKTKSEKEIWIYFHRSDDEYENEGDDESNRGTIESDCVF